MAIVLVIITILIGGLAMPLSAQIQARRIAETRADISVRGHDAWGNRYTYAGSLNFINDL